jgi:hypothetical protein
MYRLVDREPRVEPIARLKRSVLPCPFVPAAFCHWPVFVFESVIVRVPISDTTSIFTLVVIAAP